MTAEAAIFTPEVEELLREIAAEPDSVLLRVPREKVKATLLESRSPIGPMTAGLSSAERELVQVHREEFAYQLRRAAWIKLATSQQGRLFISRRVDSATTVQVPERDDVESSLLENLQSARQALSNAHGSWAFRPFDEWPDVAELCALAHRCAPHDQNRLYASVDWIFRDNCKTALGIINAVLADPCCPSTAGVALAHLAFCYDTMGTLDRSVSAWRSAFMALPDRHDVLLFWFITALRCNNDSEIAYSNRHLSATFGGSGDFIVSHLDLLLEKKKCGFWKPTSSSHQAAAAWNRKLGSAAKEITNALHN